MGFSDVVSRCPRSFCPLSGQVWDTVSGAAVAVYHHRRPVRCCLPHPLLARHVLSGGDDCSVHLWRVEDQGTAPPDAGHGTRATGAGDRRISHRGRELVDGVGWSGWFMLTG